MLPLLAELSAAPGTPILLADGSSSDGIFLPFLLGPLTFAGIYIGIYRFYRNTDKRHRYERETKVAVGNLQQDDRRTGRKTGQRSRSMDGRNDTDHLTRVRRLRVQ
ncbi:hypothetical protein DXU92_14460 [Brachybacterium saurashtrense]|uniref:Growth/differentiation factor n=1 Tax=Brachybacterium saurashtrense TaxID=556288 RepID=A0A345YT47_9MICO|nr:hypothetical protein DWV08_00560 [Brachybacterium saurashtrense]RRR21564.1 hypothetical protein DXU92_14460 [Brachybacterium saurashtrense]